MQLAGNGNRGPQWWSYAQSPKGTEPGEQAGGHSATRGQGRRRDQSSVTTFTRCSACEYLHIPIAAFFAIQRCEPSSDSRADAPAAAPPYLYLHPTSRRRAPHLTLSSLDATSTTSTTNPNDIP